MVHTDLINWLIRLRDFRHYLEISVHDKHVTFGHIYCERKRFVSGYAVDDFFECCQEKYDLIFIDGVHTDVQASKDIINALRFLREGGIVVIHDCMPPDAWHQREPELFEEGQAWNGTVWKAALRIFNEAGYRCDLLDADWGCGIIDTAAVVKPKDLPLPEILNYDEHYPLLLCYKRSVAEYIRNFVNVFYHLACMGNWKDVFREQMTQLSNSGFEEVKLSVLGTTDDMTVISDTCSELNLKSNIHFQGEDMRCFETPALRAIENFARSNSGYVLYLHSKGVSNPADQTKIRWRHLMMRELVEKWQTCMLALPNYDAVGVNWREMYNISHFSGNFWYAAVKHIRRLANFNHYYDNPRFNIYDHIDNKRLGCEFWISSCRDRPKVLSLFCNNVDFGNGVFLWNHM